MAEDLGPVYRMLDGQSETVGALQAKVAALEAEVQRQREEMRQALLDVLYELRDDSDFSRPMWASGIAHVAEHLATDDGRKIIHSDGIKTLAQRGADVIADHWTDKIARRLLWIVLGATGAALLLWLGKMGVLFK